MALCVLCIYPGTRVAYTIVPFMYTRVSRCAVPCARFAVLHARARVTVLCSGGRKCASRLRFSRESLTARIEAELRGTRVKK